MNALYLKDRSGMEGMILERQGIVNNFTGQPHLPHYPPKHKHKANNAVSVGFIDGRPYRALPIDAIQL